MSRGGAGVDLNLTGGESMVTWSKYNYAKYMLLNVCDSLANMKQNQQAFF